MGKFIVVLSLNEWNKKTRNEKYHYLKSVGATTKQAKKFRDHSYKSLVYKGHVGIAPSPKKKWGIKERRRFWSELSSYWQSSAKKQETIEKGWTPYQKKASVLWQQQAIAFNRALWDNLSEYDKKLQNWQWAENHSAGYAYVYRHYIEGKSWKRSREGIVINPVAEPDQYVG